MSISIVNFEAERRPIDSPRSLEACLRSGFDPNDLFPRPPKAFKVRGEDPNISEIKSKHFEKKRKEKVSVVTEERATIIKYLQQTQGPGASQTMESSGPSALDLARTAMEADTSTMMAMEKDRLRRIQERMAKELKGIVTMEEKVAAIQARNKEKEIFEEEKKREQLKERKARAADAATAKREKQLKKQQEEEEAEKKRKALQKAEAARERAIAEAETAAAKIRTKKAREAEIERREKQEEHRKQVEEKLASQEEAAHQSRLRMEEQERVVQEMMATKKIEMADKIQRKREMADRRIDAALKTNQEIMRRKKETFDDKQARVHARAQEIEAEHLIELKKEAEQRDKDHEMAKKRKDDAYEMEDVSSGFAFVPCMNP